MRMHIALPAQDMGLQLASHHGLAPLALTWRMKGVDSLTALAVMTSLHIGGEVQGRGVQLELAQGGRPEGRQQGGGLTASACARTRDMQFPSSAPSGR